MSKGFICFEDQVDDMQVEATEGEEITTSEDIQARTYRKFTQVECLGVYGLDTISEPHHTAEKVTENTKRVALELRYPNSETKVVTASLGYLCSEFSPYTNKEMLTSAVEGSTFWVAPYSSVFGTQLFPKMRELLVLPSKTAVDSFYDYKESNIIDADKKDTQLLAGMATTVVSFGIGIFLAIASFSVLSNSALPEFANLLSLTPMALSLFVLTQDRMDAIFNYFGRVLPTISSPHLWLSEEEWDIEDQEELTPLSEIDSDLIRFITSFSGDDTAEITNVVETNKKAELTLNKDGETFTIEMDMPYNLEVEDQPLANLVQDCGVGSVRMLENEQITVEVNVLHGNVTGLPITVTAN